MAKAPDAFRTISEVAESLDTPAHVLRFWESKFTQVKPVKRAGGRRYYRPDDVALLGGIKVLLHDQGLTIKGAQKVLRDSGLKAVMDMAEAEPAGDADVTDDGDIIDIVANIMPEPMPVQTAPIADSPAMELPADSEVTPPDNIVSLQSAIPPHVLPAAPVQVTPTLDLPAMPAPRAACASRVLHDLARLDRTALAHRAAKLEPVVARLAQLHSRMTTG